MKKKSTFQEKGWNFENIWNIDENGIVNAGYPFLTDSILTASFEVCGLSISKKTVEPAKNVTVFVRVKNESGKRGTFDVEISVNGKIKTKEVTLSPYVAGLLR